MCEGLKERLEFNETYTPGYRDPDERIDGYQLKWIGKEYAHWRAGSATETMIYPDETHNSKPENINSQNIFITGDNLEALKQMRKAYRNSVNIIYIDPPYNTGNDDFVYKDKYILDDDILANSLNFSEDEIRRLRSIEGKASHSAWLSFMYPRLRIAHELLAEDGVIFISIDDNEQSNLKLLCDEIFGESNFIGCLTWLKGNAQNDAHNMQKNHEYILVYQKDKIILKNKQNKEKTIYQDEYGYYYIWGSLTIGGASGLLSLRPKLGYSIYYHPETKEFEAHMDYDIAKAKISNNEQEVYQDKIDSIKQGYIPIRPPKNGNNLGYWKWGLEKFNAKKHLILIKPNKNGGYIVNRKEYVNPEQVQRKSGKGLFASLTSLLPLKSFVTISSLGGTKIIGEFFNNKIFEYSKPVDLIKHLIASYTEPNPIILDFFAGSGTTAHAVMELNKEDGGNRSYILCQLDEPTSEESLAYKEGYKTIDEISRKRIELAAEKLKDTSGYKHYYVKEPNNNILRSIKEFNPSLTAQIDAFIPQDYINLFADKFKNISGEQTILTTWLLQDRYKFTEQPEIIDIEGYKAYYINKSLYLLYDNWQTNHTEALLNLIGTGKLICDTIIIYGYSFNSYKNLAELKINKNILTDNYNIDIIQRY